MKFEEELLCILEIVLRYPLIDADTGANLGVLHKEVFIDEAKPFPVIVIYILVGIEKIIGQFKV